LDLLDAFVALLSWLRSRRTGCWQDICPTVFGAELDRNILLASVGDSVYFGRLVTGKQKDIRSSAHPRGKTLLPFCNFVMMAL
jgi:hypothetical protein